MRKARRLTYTRSAKTRRKKTDAEAAFASGRHLAFRWFRLEKACSGLTAEFWGWIARRTGWSLDPDRPRPPIPEPPGVEPPHGRSVWGRLAGWAILIAIPLGLYFGLSPVRHVVDATARAASTSIHLEISPPDPGDEPSYWELAGSSTDSVMPKRNRGKVFESLLGWLEVARPRLSFKQRLNELDVLDDMLVEAASEIPYFAEIPKITDDSEDHNKPRIGALCTAGDPSKPYLVVALVGGEDSSVTCTFAISWRDGDYYYQLITNPKSIAPKTSGARSREPELKAVDLDMDGRAEVIETWRGRSGRLMHVQIYKWFPSKPRWRRMSNVSNI